MVRGNGLRTVKVMTLFLSLFVILSTSVSAGSEKSQQGTPEDVHIQISSELVQPISIKQSPAPTSNISDTNFDKVIPTDEKQIPVNAPAFSIQSNFNVNGSIMDFNESLVASDTDDMWFFNVATDRTMLFKLLSTNTNYIAQLYIVDWSTGQATPTNVGVYAGGQLTLGQLPAGDYLIRVYSAGTVGDTYTLRMNATNPSNPSSILSATSTLRNVVASYSNGDIYANGSYVANTQGYNANLEWEREFYFSWGNGYNSRTHSIFNVKVRSVSAPVSYSSSYASSNNALLIYLDKGTSFMHHASYYQSGPNHVYESSFEDVTGRITPRYLDQQDFDYWGDHILVYDLNTNRAIDFYSVLNFYYGTGVEAAPVVYYLN